MGLGGARARFSNLVSADSASFPGSDGVFFPPSDVVTVVAVVDGRMRVVDVPRGARLSDVDLASLGGPGNARAAEFSSVVSVAVNREPVPPGAEVAVTLRVGDLVEVTRARLAAADGGSPGASRELGAAAAALGAAAAEEARAPRAVSATRWSPPTTWSPRRGSSLHDSCIMLLYSYDVPTPTTREPGQGAALARRREGCLLMSSRSSPTSRAVVRLCGETL